MRQKSWLEQQYDAASQGVTSLLSTKEPENLEALASPEEKSALKANATDFIGPLLTAAGMGLSTINPLFLGLFGAGEHIRGNRNAEKDRIRQSLADQLGHQRGMEKQHAMIQGQGAFGVVNQQMQNQGAMDRAVLENENRVKLQGMADEAAGERNRDTNQTNSATAIVVAKLKNDMDRAIAMIKMAEESRDPANQLKLLGQAANFLFPQSITDPMLFKQVPGLEEAQQGVLTMINNIIKGQKGGTSDLSQMSDEEFSQLLNAPAGGAPAPALSEQVLQLNQRFKK